MLLIVAPYAACAIAVACVFFSVRQLARLFAVVPVDLAACARARVPPRAVGELIDPESPLGTLAGALASPQVERARAVNEALLEIGHVLSRDRRLPRVLASVATSSCLLLSALVVRDVLGGDSADLVLEEGIWGGAFAVAFAVALWGVFAASTCVVIYGRSLQLERELTKSVDAYVDALEAREN